ncbi:hypothetical protein FRC12_001392 [Ceratobasidium sp. 428]|nr:hypothetical protein FRC12_001392 [Ceratobasidium sp. 428]
MFASLATGIDTDDELHLLKDGKTRCTARLVVSGLYHLKDSENNGQDAKFFVFSDLGVRTEGSHRLKLTLFEVHGVRMCSSHSWNRNQAQGSPVPGPLTFIFSTWLFPLLITTPSATVHHCKSIYSNSFYVYTAKGFPAWRSSPSYRVPSPSRESKFAFARTFVCVNDQSRRLIMRKRHTAVVISLRVVERPSCCWMTRMPGITPVLAAVVCTRLGSCRHLEGTPAAWWTSSARAVTAAFCDRTASAKPTSPTAAFPAQQSSAKWRRRTDTVGCRLRMQTWDPCRRIRVTPAYGASSAAGPAGPCGGNMMGRAMGAQSKHGMAPAGQNMPPALQHMPPLSQHMPPSGYGMPPSSYRMPPSSHSVPLSSHNMPPSPQHMPPSSHNVSPALHMQPSSSSHGMPPPSGHMQPPNSSYMQPSASRTYMSSSDMSSPHAALSFTPPPRLNEHRTV